MGVSLRQVHREPSSTRPHRKVSISGFVFSTAASSVSVASRAFVTPGSTNWIETIEFFESVCGHFFGLRLPSLLAGISQLSRIATVKRPSHRLVTPVELFNGFCRGHSGFTLKRVVIWVRLHLTRSRPGMPSIRAPTIANLRTRSVPNRGITSNNVGSACCSRLARITRQASAQVENPRGTGGLSAIPSGRKALASIRVYSFQPFNTGSNAATFES
jgi:hypothetical protein